MERKLNTVDGATLMNRPFAPIPFIEYAMKRGVEVHCAKGWDGT